MPVARGGGAPRRAPLTPTLLIPPPLLTGILYSSQFRSHQAIKMAARLSKYIFWLIRSLIDPSLAAFIVCGPL